MAPRLLKSQTSKPGFAMVELGDSPSKYLISLEREEMTPYDSLLSCGETGKMVANIVFAPIMSRINGLCNIPHFLVNVPNLEFFFHI